ncbi:hypothetical protein [Prosthecobacter sp.]|uniref:hypothetical protein n=1 Tax=Prosthecobacter sp. TaxID=1965333 RepID=UPI0037843AE2
MTWPQRKTCWLILGSLLGMILAAALVAHFWRPGPSIRFVGFHEGKNGRVAAFQITNDTDEPYSFYGYGRSSPYCSYKVATASGWQIQGQGWWLTSSEWYTLEPHSVTEVQVSTHDAPSTPFAVGVPFERGTAAQVSARRPRRSFIAELLLYLRAKTDPLASLTWEPGPSTDPTWSDVVPR